VAQTRFAIVRGAAGIFNAPRVWPRSDRAEALPPPEVEWFAWRLLGANNRELARSAVVFTTVRDLLADVAALPTWATADALTYDRHPRRWGWTLIRGDDRAAVAVSSRLYDLERECRFAAGLFLDAAHTAVGPTGTT
jgi:hypothetical protein